jgi:hypothetical protein
MIIQNIKPFVGVHCETTATGTLLSQLEIHLSESMLFGLGEGLGFFFWNMKNMDYPFIGGRTKMLSITRALAKNLNLTLDIKETSSIKKSWRNVSKELDNNVAVGLQLDSYHLEYFPMKFHFAGHFVAITGFDDTYAYMVDTKPNGTNVKTSLASLALARNQKGPMAAKNLMYTVQKNQKGFDLASSLVNAIKCNAEEYLNPPIENLGFKGILKTSVEIKKWYKASIDIEHEFSTTAMLMEEAGTGGALFRNLYRDFLKEAYDITNNTTIKEAYEQFVVIAKKWSDVSQLIKKAGQTKNESLVVQASVLLEELSDLEFKVVLKLQNLN